MQEATAHPKPTCHRKPRTTAAGRHWGLTTHPPRCRDRLAADNGGLNVALRTAGRVIRLGLNRSFFDRKSPVHKATRLAEPPPTQSADQARRISSFPVCARLQDAQHRPRSIGVGVDVRQDRSHPDRLASYGQERVRPVVLIPCGRPNTGSVAGGGNLVDLAAAAVSLACCTTQTACWRASVRSRRKAAEPASSILPALQL